MKKLFSQKDVLDSKIRLQICESLIFSKLSYADAIYGLALRDSDAKRLQLLQNAYLRYSTGVRRFDRVSHKFSEVDWLKLDKLRSLDLLCLTHKLLIKRIPTYFVLEIVMSEM